MEKENNSPQDAGQMPGTAGSDASESGQDKARAEDKPTVTEPAAAPPKKRGLISALKAFLSFLFRLLFRKLLGSLPIKEVECITLELVKEYFQRPKTRKLLKDKKLLAVAIREKGTAEGKIVVMLTLYDTQREELASDVEAATYRAERLDRQLEEAFGDKEMIVLQ